MHTPKTCAARTDLIESGTFTQVSFSERQIHLSLEKYTFPALPHSLQLSIVTKLVGRDSSAMIRFVQLAAVQLVLLGHCRWCCINGQFISSEFEWGQRSVRDSVCFSGSFNSNPQYFSWIPIVKLFWFEPNNVSCVLFFSFLLEFVPTFTEFCGCLSFRTLPRWATFAFGPTLHTSGSGRPCWWEALEVGLRCQPPFWLVDPGSCTRML